MIIVECWIKLYSNKLFFLQMILRDQLNCTVRTWEGIFSLRKKLSPFEWCFGWFNCAMSCFFFEWYFGIDWWFNCTIRRRVSFELKSYLRLSASCLRTSDVRTSRRGQCEPLNGNRSKFDTVGVAYCVHAECYYLLYVNKTSPKYISITYLYVVERYLVTVITWLM